MLKIECLQGDFAFQFQFIRVTVDECRDAEIVETADSTTQDRKSCEITGIIKGPYKYV